MNSSVSTHTTSKKRPTNFEILCGTFLYIRGHSFIMSYRLGVGGVSQSMTHYDREGGGGMTNYDV